MYDAGEPDNLASGEKENVAVPAGNATAASPSGSPAARAGDKALWSHRRSLRLICLYREAKAKPRDFKYGFFFVGVASVQVEAAVTRVFLAHRYKKDLWRNIAEVLNEEFNAAFTELQVKNKWKSLERAYKRVALKSRRTGQAAAHCDYEERVFLQFLQPSHALLSRMYGHSLQL